MTDDEPHYRMRGSQVAVWNCRDPEILYDGPSRTGKTRLLLEKCYGLAAQYPGSRLLICRKTRVSLNETVLQTFEDYVLGAEFTAWAGSCKRAHREKYSLPNGSEIVLGGMDQSIKIMSSEYDAIFCFESTELAVDDYEKLLTRLSNGRIPYQQIVCDCNPQGPQHWINQRAVAGVSTRFTSRLSENPKFHDGTDWTERGRAYNAVLDNLTGHRKLRLRDGKWCAAEGLVYSEFDAALHVVNVLPDWKTGNWRRYRVIDFGFNDPFVCQWWAVRDDVAIMYRELYQSGRLVEDHAREIVRLSGTERYEFSLADHDREDRETLHRHGVPTRPAIKDIDSGVDAMKARLKVQATGKPRMMFYRDALVARDQNLAEQKRPTSTVEEFDCYIYKVRTDGQAKDEPADRDNHGMDCGRYLSKQLASGAGPVVWHSGR